MTHSAQFFWEHLLYIRCIFFRNFEPGFQIFKIQYQKIGFGASGRFLAFSHVQKIIDLFTILQIFYTFALILFISFSYETSRQYGTSPFSKTLLKKSK